MTPCDCLMIPIPSECVEYCLEKILKNATVEEKQLILGLDKSLATAIFKAYNTFPINSFTDLKNNLTILQTEILLEKFKNINQFQLNYFNSSPDDRVKIINEIQNLRLDSDTNIYSPIDY
jgi:hypothetical protein